MTVKEANPHSNEQEIDWSLTTWEGARREQMRRWAELPLERSIMALEEMESVSASMQTVPSEALEVHEPASNYIHGGPSFDLELVGCTPDPLMNYLKAIGILRLISEQKDPAARGWWRNGVFWLRSTFDRDSLLRFFLDEYKPTPIVAPWAGGSGFFKKDNKKAVMSIGSSRSHRIRAYAEVIGKVQAVVEQERIVEKPRDEEKIRLIRRFRRELPDAVVAWMDVTMVLHQDGQGFAPLLGTGGNDGRLDFTQNYMQRIVALRLDKEGPVDDRSRACLEQAIFATPARLDNASVGQFAPGRAGGVNATQGMEGDATDNPWDFVLMIEGTLFFAGAAVRRFDVVDCSRAAFPFTVYPVAAGSLVMALKDEAASRGELWLPLWTRPTSAPEVQLLLGEGRASVSGRPAQDGVDFIRAIGSLGVDRGIAEYHRVAFLKRSGKAYLATPLGQFESGERIGVDLLQEVDPWLNKYRRASGEKHAPPRFGTALRRVDSAVFEFCKYGGAKLFQEIIVALGAAERVLVLSEGFRAKMKLRPLAGLSASWIKAADDHSPEFDVALSLASIHDRESKIGPLRTNLEPVEWRKRSGGWAEKDRAVVWNAADLATNMTNVLQRRMMDGARAGCNDLPLASQAAVPLASLNAYIYGELDDKRIEDLIWGLMLITYGRSQMVTRALDNDKEVARAYALLKLLFLPRPLVVAYGKNGEVSARLLREHEQEGTVIRPEAAILDLLRGGRPGEACTLAMRRLRASGLAPLPGPVRGRRVRDDDWRELDGIHGGGMDPKRLAAALLIPIPASAVCTLARLVIRGDTTKDN